MTTICKISPLEEKYFCFAAVTLMKLSTSMKELNYLEPYRVKVFQGLPDPGTFTNLYWMSAFNEQVYFSMHLMFIPDVG